MNTEHKDEEAIFKAALKLKSTDERTAYLKKACGNNAELLARVKELLKAYDESGDFLESPPMGSNVTLDDSYPTEGPGMKIGRYKLLQLIGEGGFGVVYMAEQQKPIRRRVALKIIKLGMDTKQVIARFEAERQALAMMDHPNIARVFDAGATDTGRPYFVMELVKGIPITEYCDKNNLDTHQRLKLFIDVCKAVQHAHQKGIIHRDIKPSNVMITLHDGKPVPKIIDFGIAKATQQRLTEKTLFTEFKQFIGTPEYMSPEQAEMSGLDVDTRSDIYSLGVLLYEQLTGTTPFAHEQLLSVPYDQMRKVISETDPPKPSTRLSTLGEPLTDIAKHRNVQPAQLCKIVRGDLDWIVMKALEKDRTRRYESANEFALDIGRHLGHEPVVAGPPSTIYRVRKFTRRHRTGVAAGLSLAASLVIGLSLAITGFVQASQQRDLTEIQRQRAQANFEKAQDAVDEMTKIAQEQLDGIPSAERVRQNVLQKAKIFYQGFIEEESDDPAVREEAGEACLRLAELQFLFLHDQDKMKTCNQAVDIFEGLLAEFPEEPEYRYKLAYAFIMLSINNPNSLKILPRALEIAEKLVVEFPNDPKFLNLLGEVYHWLGHNLGGEPTPQFGTSADAFLKSLAIHERAVALSPDEIKYKAQLGHICRHAGISLSMTGDPNGAEEVFQKGWFILKKLADDVPYIASLTESPQFFIVRHSFFFVEFLVKEGRFDEAQKTLSETLPYAQNLTDHYPHVNVFWNDLITIYTLQGDVYLGLGQTDESAEAYQNALAMQLSQNLPEGFGINDWEQERLLSNLTKLVDVLISAERYSEAIETYGVLEDKVVVVPPWGYQHLYKIAEHYTIFGNWLFESGMVDESKQTYDVAVSTIENMIDNLPESAEHYHSMAGFLATCPDILFWDSAGVDELIQEAVTLAQKCVEISPQTPEYWNILGVACYRAGEWLDAITALHESLELRGDNSFDFFLLAMVHWQLGEEDEASGWYNQAVELIEEDVPQNDDLDRLHAEAAELLGVSQEAVQKESEPMPQEEE